MVEPDLQDPWYGLYELGWALEVPLLLVSLGSLAFGLFRHFPLGLHRLYFRVPNPGLGFVRAGIVFAAFWFWWVLQTGAASDILGFYTWLYVALAFACLMSASFSRPIVGLYYPADVLERWNPAAGVVFAGFVLGTAFAFGGALTGEGPGWWVVLVFFLLAYAELRGSLALVSRLAGSLRDDVQHERDLSAAILLAGVAIASGLVSGRAAAGDFLGWGHGLRDYGERLSPLLAIAFGSAVLGALTREKEARLIVRAGFATVLVLGGLFVYFFT